MAKSNLHPFPVYEAHFRHRTTGQIRVTRTSFSAKANKPLEGQVADIRESLAVFLPWRYDDEPCSDYGGELRYGLRPRHEFGVADCDLIDGFVEWNLSGNVDAAQPWQRFRDPHFSGQEVKPTRRANYKAMVVQLLAVIDGGGDPAVVEQARRIAA